MSVPDRFLDPSYAASYRVDCEGYLDCKDCQGTGVRADLPDYVLDLMADGDPALNCPKCSGRGLVPCGQMADTGYDCQNCGFMNEVFDDQEPDYED